MDIKVLGIDLGKTVCSLAGLDEVGAVVFRKRLQRHRLLDFRNHPIDLAITHKCPAGVLRDGRLRRGRRGGRSHARLPSSPVVRRKRGRGSLRDARRP